MGSVASTSSRILLFSSAMMKEIGIVFYVIKKNQRWPRDRSFDIFIPERTPWGFGGSIRVPLLISTGLSGHEYRGT